MNHRLSALAALIGGVSVGCSQAYVEPMFDLDCEVGAVLVEDWIRSNGREARDCHADVDCADWGGVQACLWIEPVPVSRRSFLWDHLETDVARFATDYCRQCPEHRSGAQPVVPGEPATCIEEPAGIPPRGACISGLPLEQRPGSEPARYDLGGDYWVDCLDGGRLLHRLIKEEAWRRSRCTADADCTWVGRMACLDPGQVAVNAVKWGEARDRILPLVTRYCRRCLMAETAWPVADAASLCVKRGSASVGQCVLQVPVPDE